MKNLVLLMLFLVMANFNEVSAAETGLGFTYQTIIPENQLSDGSYFDLLVKPGQKQPLTTILTNQTDKKMTVNVKLGDAGTTEEGVIDYGGKTREKNALLFTKIAKAPKAIELEPHGSKNLVIELTLPNDSFSGVILGGVELSPQSSKASEKELSGIDNEYSYLYSVSLKMDEKQPKAKLKADNSAYSKELRLLETQIVNDTQVIVKDLAIESVLTQKGNEKVLYATKLTDYKLAPTSTLPLKQEVGELAVGEYVMTIKATAGQEKWEWQHSFQVKEGNESAEKNLKDGKEQESFPVVLILLLGGTLLLTMVIFSSLVLYKEFKRKNSVRSGRKRE